MITRILLLDLEKLLKFFPVVAILGPRQCGKTTLVKEFIHRSQRAAIYLDLESPGDRNKLSEPEIFFKDNIEKIIVLDEIQRMSELFPVLRSIIDRYRESSRFIILGSASPGIMRDSSESLAGRIVYKHLAPFNLTEVGHDLQETLWLRGGFPESFLAENSDIAKLWVQNFVSTYVERDLPLLGLNASPTMLFNLWKIIASAQGALFNSNNISRSMGITSPTVNRYIDFMEEAFLIYRLHPFYVNISKRLVKSSKLYIRDSGILHYLIDNFQEENFKVWMSTGSSWEGFVVEQIRQLLPTGLAIYFYRTQSGTECDLVIANGIKPIAAIEIKFSLTPRPEKGFTVAIQDLKTGSNFIITPGNESYALRENIKVVGLFEFLSDILPGLH